MTARSQQQKPSLPSGRNNFELLESGEQYFPAVFAAIAGARREIIIETFILFDDEIGRALQQKLISAARRGVDVDLTVDGYGSPDLSDEFVQALVSAGVRLHIFDPRPRLFGLRTNIFRRMHRKIVVIDGVIAYVGGINYSTDQLACKEPCGKLDFAVRISGPLVTEIHHYVSNQAQLFATGDNRYWRRAARNRPATTPRGGSEFVIRDNDRHRNDIERRYRAAIHAARTEIIICNAYFFPGYRLLHALRRAARRGVHVNLILQGAPDMPAVKASEKLLYANLLQAGVTIFEYAPHPLHAKIAVIDQEWSTVGSSNLDPLSLSMNLEANVMIRNPQFNRMLRARLRHIMDHDCQLVPTAAESPQRRFWKPMLQTLVYHFTRHFPKWAGWLPAHVPELHSIDRSRHITHRQTEVADSRSRQ